MKLRHEHPAGELRFTGYASGEIRINDQIHQQPVILYGRTLVSGWTDNTIGTLDAADAETLSALPVSVLLLGTGSRHCFPPMAIAAACAKAGIGLEAMGTAAASRTYNILANEGRSVAAAVLLP